MAARSGGTGRRETLSPAHDGVPFGWLVRFIGRGDGPEAGRTRGSVVGPAALICDSAGTCSAYSCGRICGRSRGCTETLERRRAPLSPRTEREPHERASDSSRDRRRTRAGRRPRSVASPRPGGHRLERHKSPHDTTTTATRCRSATPAGTAPEPPPPRTRSAPPPGADAPRLRTGRTSHPPGSSPPRLPRPFSATPRGQSPFGCPRATPGPFSGVGPWCVRSDGVESGPGRPRRRSPRRGPPRGGLPCGSALIA